MEEYMRLLMEQIRCKKAHPYIQEEIKGHIEEQIAENISTGMSKADAEMAAVKDMGDPVEVGISLDRIHKPQIAWELIGIMAFISIAGIILHQIISRQIDNYPLISNQIEAQAIGSSDFTVYTIVGFILMLLVYRIDYSIIARFSKIIAILFLGSCILALFNGNMTGGMIFSINIFAIRVSLFAVMTLYVPLYGAVIYKYHGLGYGALAKAIMWMLVPTFIAFRLPSLPLAMILLFSMSVVLTVAIAQGWFKVSKKKVMIALWGCELGLPIVYLSFAFTFELLAPHQMDRIKAFLTNSGDANYITTFLRTNLFNSRLIGNNGKELLGSLPNFNSDYIFSYLISTYGFLLGAIVCCVLAVLILKIFSISFRQKNQLGLCMGCGCGMIILLNVIINISECLGLLPVTQTFLPFFSTGGSSIIVCYILMGIILSIYRYKNIYPANVNARIPIVRITINL